LKKNKRIKPDKVVDVIGEVCPIPLKEMRDALNVAESGEIIEIIGTHKNSKEEIPIAIESSGDKLLAIEEEEGIWHIFVQKA